MSGMNDGVVVARHMANASVVPNNLALGVATAAIIGTGQQSAFAHSSLTALSTGTFPPCTLTVPSGFTVVFFGQARLQEAAVTLADMNIEVFADNTTPQTNPAASVATFAATNYSSTVPLVGEFTGLGAGSHSFSLWANSTSGASINIANVFVLFMVVAN